MRTIIEFGLRQRVLILCATVLLVILGAAAALKLPIDAVPDITNVQVQILSDAPGLAPQEIEEQITFPVEAALNGIPGLEEVRSISRFGMSAVTAVFEEGTDLYFARQLVQERISTLQRELSTNPPEMGPISSGLGEIFQFEVRGEPMCPPQGVNDEKCYTPMELRELLDHYINHRLRRINGVVEINGYGGEVKTYEVSIDPRRLNALDIGLDQIFTALESNNANTGGGYLVHAGEQRLIRGEARIASLADLESIAVRSSENGTAITIGDLGDVRLAPMIRAGAVTRDGQGETVIGIAMMLMGANSREVATALQEEVARLQASLPPGVTIETFYDRSELVDRTIHTVAKNLLEGGALVIIVLLLMLGNFRAGLMVAAAIPLSMLAAMIAMRYAGISGNLMSLGAIDFGLIVDGSVVMVEHILRSLAESRAKGAAVLQVVGRSAKEVATPIVFAVAIIILVFVPVLTLEGIEGKMFTPMAWTVIFALLASLALALILMPALCAMLFRRGAQEHEPWLIRALRRFYEPILLGAMHKRKITIAATVLFFGVASYRLTTLGAEFLPRLDEGSIAIQTTRLASVSIEESVRFTTRMETAILDHFPDEISTVVSKTGRPEIATDPMGVETTDHYLALHPRERWTHAATTQELVEKIEAMLVKQVPGQAYLFSQPIELRTNELVSGSRADVALAIYGENLQTLAKLGEASAQVFRSLHGSADVSVEQVAGLPLVRIRVDRQALARYGVPAHAVLDAIATIAGRPTGEVLEGPRRYTLQVRIDPEYRTQIEDLRRLPITTLQGKTVALGELTEITLETGPAQISRQDIQRKLTVQSNVRGRDLGSFVREAQTRIENEVDLPPGYFVKWGGQFEHLEQAAGRLAIAVPTALLTILVVLMTAFGSLRSALIVFLNVPFAAIGGVIALDLRSMPLSISAGVGFIALFGIAMLNGVVMISQIRDLQRQGHSRHLATKQGALTRLRPVLMTAMVASLGFVPMALATSAGAEVQRPLATVVIGGLLTSTFLTLLVLPTIYNWIGDGPSESETAEEGEQLAIVHAT
jgi:cobalt-zinc-cadmium resistance protein CzcA